MYCEAHPDEENTKGKCTKPIKPNITFFGEELPTKFMNLYKHIEKRRIDLMIVMGTALAVTPFNQIVDRVECPQVLINLQNTAHHGFDFEDPVNRPDRLLWQGKCDEVICQIAKECGWFDNLKERIMNAGGKMPEGFEDEKSQDLLDAMDRLAV